MSGNENSENKSSRLQFVDIVNPTLVTQIYHEANKIIGNAAKWTIAKHKFSEFDPRILEELMKPENDILENISSTEVRLKANLDWNKLIRIQEIAGSDFEKIRDILQQSEVRTEYKFEIKDFAPKTPDYSSFEGKTIDSLKEFDEWAQVYALAFLPAAYGDPQLIDKSRQEILSVIDKDPRKRDLWSMVRNGFNQMTSITTKDTERKSHLKTHLGTILDDRKGIEEKLEELNNTRTLPELDEMIAANNVMSSVGNGVVTSGEIGKIAAGLLPGLASGLGAIDQPIESFVNAAMNARDQAMTVVDQRDRLVRNLRILLERPDVQIGLGNHEAVRYMLNGVASAATINPGPAAVISLESYIKKIEDLLIPVKQKIELLKKLHNENPEVFNEVDQMVMLENEGYSPKKRSIVNKLDKDENSFLFSKVTKILGARIYYVDPTVKILMAHYVQEEGANKRITYQEPTALLFSTSSSVAKIQAQAATPAEWIQRNHMYVIDGREKFTDLVRFTEYLLKAYRANPHIPVVGYLDKWCVLPTPLDLVKERLIGSNDVVRALSDEAVSRSNNMPVSSDGIFDLYYFASKLLDERQIRATPFVTGEFKGVTLTAIRESTIESIITEYNKVVARPTEPYAPQGSIDGQAATPREWMERHNIQILEGRSLNGIKSVEELAMILVQQFQTRQRPVAAEWEGTWLMTDPYLFLEAANLVDVGQRMVYEWRERKARATVLDRGIPDLNNFAATLLDERQIRGDVVVKGEFGGITLVANGRTTLRNIIRQYNVAVKSIPSVGPFDSSREVKSLDALVKRHNILWINGNEIFRKRGRLGKAADIIDFALDLIDFQRLNPIQPHGGTWNGVSLILDPFYLMGVSTVVANKIKTQYDRRFSNEEEPNRPMESLLDFAIRLLEERVIRRDSFPNAKQFEAIYKDPSDQSDDKGTSLIVTPQSTVKSIIGQYNRKNPLKPYTPNHNELRVFYEDKMGTGGMGFIRFLLEEYRWDPSRPVIGLTHGKWVTPEPSDLVVDPYSAVSRISKELEDRINNNPLADDGIEDVRDYAEELLHERDMRQTQQSVDKVTFKGIQLIVSPQSTINSIVEDYNQQTAQSPSATDDQAMKVTEKRSNGPGGIDLSPANNVLQTRNAGIGIKFHLDAAQLAQWQKAPGVMIEDITIQPLKSLSVFLGLPDSQPV